jgi:hypothetical protein
MVVHPMMDKWLDGDGRRQCQCHAWSGGVKCWWSSVDEDDMVTVEWMPHELRPALEDVADAGEYPRNGAVRSMVTRQCAQRMLEEDPNWVEVIE